MGLLFAQRPTVVVHTCVGIPGPSLTLTGGMVLPGSSIQNILLQLDIDDLNILKGDLQFATFVNDTYLSATENTVVDGNGLKLMAISPFDALLASNHSRDTMPPILEDVGFDLNEGKLTLTFDEAINSSSLDVMKVRLSADPDHTYDLTGGEVSMLSLTVAEIELTLDDLNNIKADLDLATEESTPSSFTFLTATLCPLNRPEYTAP